MIQIPVVLSFTETVNLPPGSDPKALFSGGAQSSPGATETGAIAATVSLDPAVLAGLFPASTGSAAPAHLTTDELAAQYTVAELSTALSARAVSGKG